MIRVLSGQRMYVLLSETILRILLNVQYMQKLQSVFSVLFSRNKLQPPTSNH